MGDAGFEKLLSLISEKRLRPSSRGGVGLLIASESDKGRVINSSAFRRLQQKAQVFPLEPNAAVRTRLTHSIEVSQIGRHLAQKVIGNFDHTSGIYDKLTAFVNTIETACLLHDIGNPPFGHLGESAIKEWFSSQKKISIHNLQDLLDFDGNPQGFRLMTFLGGADDHGFNLTCTLLLSTIKYPWDLATKPEDKKLGIFSVDYANYQTACEYVGWAVGKKFPFVRLMDTADEIAYSMSDLEDGLEKEIISIEDLKQEFGESRFKTEVLSPFLKFKTDVINEAVSVAAEKFTENIDAVLAGQDQELISKQSEIGELLARVNKFARARIYSDKAAEQVELAGRSVIRGLLEHFGGLMTLSEDNFVALLKNDRTTIRKERLDFQIRLLRRLPKGYLDKYQSTNRGVEPYRRAHLIVDFISGMTDDFALETYQILEGIRIK